jgi:hypothetical protein
LLKLLRLSKKDSKVGNSGKVIEDKQESKGNINPIKKRKINSRAAVTRVRKALVLKKPYKKKVSGR